MRIRVNDLSLYFDVEGAALAPDGQCLRERPVVIALHGGPGFDHAYFKPALSVLVDTAQVVYLDLRGQGRSGRVPAETCTLEQMADDVAAVCDALGLVDPVILGHSAGGFVALHLAVRHPDLAGRLILVDTAAATADLGDAMEQLERRCGPVARTAAERVFGGDMSSEAMADFDHLVLPAYAHDPVAAGPVFDALARSSFSAEVASYYFQERAPLYDLRAQLGSIAVPTLVVVGESDWLCPPSASWALARGIPGAELVVIPGAGHFAWEQPVSFADAVCRFLVAA